MEKRRCRGIETYRNVYQRIPLYTKHTDTDIYNDTDKDKENGTDKGGYRGRCFVTVPGMSYGLSIGQNLINSHKPLKLVRTFILPGFD